VEAEEEEKRERESEWEAQREPESMPRSTANPKPSLMFIHEKGKPKGKAEEDAELEGEGKADEEAEGEELGEAEAQDQQEFPPRIPATTPRRARDQSEESTSQGDATPPKRVTNESHLPYMGTTVNEHTRIRCHNRPNTPSSRRTESCRLISGCTRTAELPVSAVRSDIGEYPLQPIC
jgi:hypothetical protein